MHALIPKDDWHFRTFSNMYFLILFIYLSKLVPSIGHVKVFAYNNYLLNIMAFGNVYYFPSQFKWDGVIVDTSNFKTAS